MKLSIDPNHLIFKILWIIFVIFWCIKLFLNNYQPFDEKLYLKSKYKDTIFNTNYRLKNGLQIIEINSFKLKKGYKSIYYQNKNNSEIPSVNKIEYKFIFESGIDVFKISKDSILESNYYLADKEAIFTILIKKKWSFVKTVPYYIEIISAKDAYYLLKKKKLLNPNNNIFYYMHKDSLSPPPITMT